MAGKQIPLTEELRAYLVEHSDPPRSQVHRDLVALTAEQLGGIAIMQVAEEQGPWLSFMVRLTRARRAVEVGTFTGYSALCIAEALPADGTLTCFDISSEWVDMGRPFWDTAGVADKIDVVIGNATETMSALEGPVDFAFVDADKTNYLTYYETILAVMEPGGVIVADNTLWSGAVLDENDQSEDTVAIRDFNRHVVEDDRVDALLVNIGDGLMLARKR
jgi:caffeoyl-CoA O-methyltransferase